jgi:hypothetical protein
LSATFSLPFFLQPIIHTSSSHEPHSQYSAFSRHSIFNLPFCPSKSRRMGNPQIYKCVGWRERIGSYRFFGLIPKGVASGVEGGWIDDLRLSSHHIHCRLHRLHRIRGSLPSILPNPLSVLPLMSFKY